ncbi:hypothetical protein [Rhodoferax saidenbachensis]|uniref:DUF4153 domain-containing protein n=1 Tax=Rhodoferax saidenbachensis TaxID=1484693 RepID=A0ABU1ZQJ5_9BURK|nr:hypothetical protein [Rhodoferax saidenbachensis]MDR7307653.1 hypothetical protein [Rhodoferax saidenbachensis]
MPKFIKKKSAASSAIKPVWSHKTRRIFLSLSEIPWLSLTALGTLLGVTILFWYFRSIDFFPSDYSVLIGLGVGAAASAFGVLCVLALGLFAPAALYRAHISESEEKKAEVKQHFTELEMVGLQLGGVGLVFGATAYPELRDCGIWLSFSSVLSVGMLLLWLVTLVKILLAREKQTSWRDTTSTAVGIAAANMFTFVILASLLPVFSSAYLSAGVILITLWMVAIFANASAAVRLRLLEISIAAGIVVVVLFVLLPAAASKRNLFPEMTASFLGIRDDAPADLRVPTKTCQLIRSAVPDGMVSKDLRCDADDWGKVKAQVLSKVGDQWLIEFSAEKKSDPVAVATFRITIPRSDVQVIREIEDRPFLGQTRACQVAGN